MWSKQDPPGKPVWFIVKFTGEFWADNQQLANNSVGSQQWCGVTRGLL